MSRVDMWDKVVMFGLQGFIKKYLIEYFNDEFFGKSCEEAVGEYKRIMDAALGKDAYKIDKIEKLHKLGYLPIEIISLPDASQTPSKPSFFT
jgi:nicotinamide phosphoribosyltransferase